MFTLPSISLLGARSTHLLRGGGYLGSSVVNARRRGGVFPYGKLSFSSSSPASSTDDIFSSLNERGLIAASTIPVEELSELSKEHKPTVYAGFDPTADSLHVGNFLLIKTLLRLHKAGHKVIFLLGGATACIGDPSGKSTERPLLQESEIIANAQSIESNLRSMLPQEGEDRLEVVNNMDWYRGLTLLDFLREAGKYTRVGTMMGRESVKKRLESEEGISFTEFTYQVLQGWDYYVLHKEKGCTLQIGGSDQWGNIVGGCDLISKRLASSSSSSSSSSSPPSLLTKPQGLTIPLLTTPSGEKFGKSAGNAIWLSSSKTSHYRFYQHFVRVPDSQVEQLLLLFTDLSLQQVQELMQRHREAPEDLVAQKTLASLVTSFVRGQKGLDSAIAATMAVHSKDSDLSSLSPEDLEDVLSELPMAELQREKVVGQDLPSIYAAAGFGSKSHARRLIASGAVSMNKEKIKDPLTLVSEGDLIHDSVLSFKVGKKHTHVIRLI